MSIIKRLSFFLLLSMFSQASFSTDHMWEPGKELRDYVGCLGKCYVQADKCMPSTIDSKSVKKSVQKVLVCRLQLGVCLSKCDNKFISPIP